MEGAGEKPDWQLEREAEDREILAGATFSIFAPEGFRVELSAWGGGDGEPVRSVGLRREFGEDQWIDVESEVDAHHASFEDEAAHRLGGLGVAPGRSGL